jgi:hypothetical protein
MQTHTHTYTHARTHTHTHTTQHTHTHPHSCGCRSGTAARAVSGRACLWSERLSALAEDRSVGESDGIADGCCATSETDLRVRAPARGLCVCVCVCVCLCVHASAYRRLDAREYEATTSIGATLGGRSLCRRCATPYLTYVTATPYLIHIMAEAMSGAAMSAGERLRRGREGTSARGRELNNAATICWISACACVRVRVWLRGARVCVCSCARVCCVWACLVEAAVAQPLVNLHDRQLPQRAERQGNGGSGGRAPPCLRAQACVRAC